MANVLAHAPKSILITGASSGIGLATAKHFSKKGWQVAATMRNPSDAPAWMTQEEVRVLPLDVTDQRSVDVAVRRALTAFGKIDVAFCNAGYGLNGPVEGASETQMAHQFDVNVLGVVRTMKAVLPHMRQRKQGRILVTSSIAGLIGMPVSPLYIASKHAVEGLIESARFELKPFGIQLKLIEPGGTRTDFSNRSAAWTAHDAYADVIVASKEMSVNILASAPQPTEIARVVYKAAIDGSDRLRYLAKPGPYVALYRLLPDRWWRAIIQTALNRAAKARIADSSFKTGAK
jgi:NAD(P)-dependent dehydrogenase (short-subunit alcohol dehydrogenase family)